MSIARELAELGGSYGTGGFVGMKNRIINGDFNVVQRGASGTTTSSGYVSLDRWRASISVASTVTLSQQTFTPGQIDVPGDPEFFMRYDWLGTSPAATKNIMQRVENVKSLVGAAALSFYAKTELGDDVTIEVRQNFGSGGSSEVTVLSQSIDCTTGWNKFEIPINLPSLSGKTIGAGSYIEVSWKAVDGSNSYLDLARVQLEKGSTATSFDYRPYGTELALCQRYLPAYTGSGEFGGSGNAVNGSVFYATYTFPVTPRVPPTGLTINSVSNMFSGVAGITADTSLTTLSASNASNHSCLLYGVQSSATLTAGQVVTIRGNSSAIAYFTGCEL